MLVEAEVEVTFGGPAPSVEPSEWVRQAFGEASCARAMILGASGAAIRARVGISTDKLPEPERELIEGRPHDQRLLQAFVEKMFVGTGACRVTGAVALRAGGGPR